MWVVCVCRMCVSAVRHDNARCRIFSRTKSKCQIESKTLAMREWVSERERERAYVKIIGHTLAYTWLWTSFGAACLCRSEWKRVRCDGLAYDNHCVCDVCVCICLNLYLWTVHTIHSGHTHAANSLFVHALAVYVTFRQYLECMHALISWIWSFVS